MATIINNPTPIERVAVVEQADTSSGWIVAIIILLLVIAGGSYAWIHYHRAAAAPPASGGTNINVTLPSNPNPATTP